MTFTLNNFVRKNNNKSSLYGAVGSALSCIVLFLIMWFYVLPHTSIPQPIEEEEGLMVSFGDNENAGGMGSSAEPLAEPESEMLAPAVKVEQKSTVVNEQLITQNDNTNEIAEIKRKDQERKEKLLIEKQKQETEQRISDQRKKEQEAVNKAASVNGLFANGSTVSGKGNGKGSGNGSGDGSGNGSESGIQGNPAGHGNLGGNSFSLSGRSLTGKLLSPNYDKDVEGKVTVNIRVDESGRVTSTSIGSPTTISETVTRNAAMTAARNTRFSAGSGIVTGVITYNFKLR